MKALLVIMTVFLFAGCYSPDTSSSPGDITKPFDNRVIPWRMEKKMTSGTPCVVGGDALATFKVGDSLVDILIQYYDNDTCVLLARWDDSVCRWVRLIPLADKNKVGYSAEILNGGVVLFGTQLLFDSVDTDVIELTEYTPDDKLQIVINDCPGDSLSESYCFNNTSPTEFRRAKSTTQSEMEQIVLQVEAEKNLTDESIFGYGSTLYYNDDGERLINLVRDDSFARWVFNLSNSGELVVDTYRWGWSDWITGCALAKCLLGGGPANPVCATCTVVSGGLWFAKAVTCLIDCDAWPEGM